MPCPSCGYTALRRSKRSGGERLAGIFTGLRPYRCLQCGHRSWHGIRYRQHPVEYLVPRALLLVVVLGGMSTVAISRGWVQLPALEPATAQGQAVPTRGDAAMRAVGQVPASTDSAAPTQPPAAAVDLLHPPAEAALSEAEDDAAQVMPEAAEDAGTRMAAATRVNARSGPGRAHGIVRVLDVGTEVRVFEQQEAWGRALLDDVEIWVYMPLMEPVE